MQYCLLMHYQEGPEIGLTEEDMAPARAAFARYADDLDAAGVLIGTQVLQSAVASTTLTARDGTPTVKDGPFADTKERLGGVFVIDVPDKLSPEQDDAVDRLSKVMNGNPRAGLFANAKADGGDSKARSS